jgi:hypothetical protein
MANRDRDEKALQIEDETFKTDAHIPDLLLMRQPLDELQQVPIASMPTGDA